MTERLLSAAVIAVGIWWNANTISHLFIHRPFFRRRAANLWFAAGLTALVGFPQSLWRDRHLAHHAGARYRLRVSPELALQTLLVLSLWAAMAAGAPAFFLSVYVPGYLAGVLLSAAHGHYEHAGGTTSHYGRLYNLLCFNDGYHVEHHLHPGLPWARLPERRAPGARASRWPAPIRWLETISTTEDTQDGRIKPVPVKNAPPCPSCPPWWRVSTGLEGLERLVLRSPRLQTLVLRWHARALGALVAALPPFREVAIVGGGLFPRTALILRDLAPDAHLTIIDASGANLDRARSLLQDDRVTFVHARYDTKSEICALTSEMLIFPLSLDGDRDTIYAHPPAPVVIVHDWIWRRRGVSRVVSALLLKRVNLVRLKADTTYEHGGERST